jgi:hypothetical protein
MAPKNRQHRRHFAQLDADADINMSCAHARSHRHALTQQTHAPARHQLHARTNRVRLSCAHRVRLLTALVNPAARPPPSIARLCPWDFHFSSKWHGNCFVLLAPRPSGVQRAGIEFVPPCKFPSHACRIRSVTILRKHRHDIT